MTLQSTDAATLIVAKTPGCLIVQTREGMLGTTGIRLPVYCEMDTLLADPVAWEEFLVHMENMIRECAPPFDVLASIEAGASVHAGVLAMRLGKPLARIYKEKGSLDGLELAGASVEGRTVLLMDDVATTLVTLTQAVKVIRKAGGRRVNNAVTMATHGLADAVARGRDEDLHYLPVVKVADALAAKVALGEATAEDLAIYLEWQKDPGEYYQKTLFSRPPTTVG